MVSLGGTACFEVSQLLCPAPIVQSGFRGFIRPFLDPVTSLQKGTHMRTYILGVRGVIVATIIQRRVFQEDGLDEENYQ
ncbi:unnamed protein product, partial [Mesorhabditis spiculigera]